NSFQKGDQHQTGQTIFIRGFDKSLGKEIRASLNEHFRSCREISRVSVPKYFESGGVIYSFAYIDFKDFSSMKKALELNETELAGGYYLSVKDR
ncbi:hypothetical protein S83_009739, partial [Arachis hypogaea]